MRQQVYLTLTVLVFVLTSSVSIGADSVDHGTQKLGIGQLAIDVPKVIQKDLYEKAVQAVLRVYPKVNEDALRDGYSKCFMRSPWVVSHVYGTQGPVGTCNAGPNVEVSFPVGDRIFLYAYDLPPGITPKKLKEPLTQKGAEKLAQDVVLHLFPDAKGIGDFTLLYSGKPASRNVCFFEWQESRPRIGQATGTGARVEIGLDDGLVHHCRLLPSLPEPKVASDSIHAIAQQSLPKFNPEHLSLRKFYYAGQGRLIWYYAVPPIPKGHETDVCYWDANTGKLLYSEVLNGGTYDKPYRDPEFFVEQNEESFRRNIEEAIKKRVAELEKQQK